MTTHRTPDHNSRPKRPAQPRPTDPFDGILLIDKPAGITSHDVVDALRRQFDLKKVGHGGTLDPQATGLLVMLLGRGTKLSNYFMSGDKTYEGTLRLGAETDSQDADGEIVREGDYSDLTREDVDAAMKRFTGDMMQTPPMVSAVKVKGVPLYKRARKGQTIEREPKLIHVYEFTMLTFDPPDATFRIRCTKGTYVRTLCADIGKALECGGHLAALRRTACGDLDVAQALTLDDALALDKTDLSKAVIPMRRFAAHLHKS